MSNITENRKVYLTRVYNLSAAHRLSSPYLTDEENDDLYGKCGRSSGHGHNYTLKLTLSGTADPATGMLVDIRDIDEIVNKYRIGLEHEGKIKIKEAGFPLGIRVGNKYETTVNFEYAEASRFTSEEILILNEAGYSSLDDIYFLAEKLTFTEARIEWEMIEKLKRLLAAPVVLLSWSREVKGEIDQSINDDAINEVETDTNYTIQESIPAVTLNRLKNADITRTIERLRTNVSFLSILNTFN